MLVTAPPSPAPVPPSVLNETLQLAAFAGTVVGSMTWQTPTGWIVRPPSLAVQWLSSGPITTPDGESAPVLRTAVGCGGGAAARGAGQGRDEKSDDVIWPWASPLRRTVVAFHG